jgi:hypothetical protein
MEPWLKTADCATCEVHAATGEKLESLAAINLRLQQFWRRAHGIDPLEQWTWSDRSVGAMLRSQLGSTGRLHKFPGKRQAKYTIALDPMLGGKNSHVAITVRQLEKLKEDSQLITQIWATIKNNSALQIMGDSLKASVGLDQGKELQGADGRTEDDEKAAAAASSSSGEAAGVSSSSSESEVTFRNSHRSPAFKVFIRELRSIYPGLAARKIPKLFMTIGMSIVSELGLKVTTQQLAELAPSERAIALWDEECAAVDELRLAERLKLFAGGVYLLADAGNKKGRNGFHLLLAYWDRNFQRVALKFGENLSLTGKKGENNAEAVRVFLKRVADGIPLYGTATDSAADVSFLPRLFAFCAGCVRSLRTRSRLRAGHAGSSLTYSR